MRRCLILVMVLLTARVVSAQDSLSLNKLYLGTASCTFSSGSGSPNGAVTGSVCDVFVRTDTGTIYTKTSGTNTNTGWSTSALTGSGTANTLAMWTSASNLSDSHITETSGNLTLAPTGDIYLSPGGVDVLPNTGYTVNLGALTNKYLTLHAAELWVETLVAQQTMATIGGRILVAPTNTLLIDLAPATTSITVKYNNLNNGDRVYMESSGKLEWMAVTNTGCNASATPPYTCTVTRNLDGSGANQWYAGDALVNTGTTGNGYIDLYSTSGVLGAASGPSIVGNVRTGTTYSDIAPRWAIGNLNGVYSYATDIYGFAAGDPLGTWITADATNGFRIRHWNGASIDDKLNADTSGNLSLTGDLTIGTAGTLRSGATSYSSGTGFIFEYNGGTPRFRVGNPAGNNLTWDGSTLSMTGDGGGITNINGGSIQTGTITVGQLLATGFGDNNIKNGTFEGANSTQALAGWVQESSGGTFTLDCCGSEGPGTLKIGSTSSGQFNSAIYYAFPVTAGQTYRVSADIATTTATSKGFYLRINESTSSSTYVRWIKRVSSSSPDVTMTSSTDVCSDCAVTGTATFTRREFTYTVPSGVRWVSLDVFNYTCTSAGGTCGDMYVDAVEFQLQIGAGHIKANSITAGQIAAGTITATEIAANTITAAKIAAGTITATEIAANTITAGKLSVSSLDAISANLGTITAGTISGVTISGSTINAGGSNVVLDSSGVLITSGTSNSNKVRWSTGGAVWETSGQMHVASGSSSVILTSNAGDLFWTANALYANSASNDLGSSSKPWQDLYLSGTVKIPGGLATGSSGNMVCIDGGGNFYKGTTTGC